MAERKRLTQNFDEVQEILNAVADKVDKVEGKDLSTNDYSNEDKQKLGDLPARTALDQMLFGKQNVYRCPLNEIIDPVEGDLCIVPEIRSEVELTGENQSYTLSGDTALFERNSTQIEGLDNNAYFRVTDGDEVTLLAGTLGTVSLPARFTLSPGAIVRFYGGTGGASILKKYVSVYDTVSSKTYIYFNGAWILYTDFLPINSLESTSITRSLSANMGRVLHGLIKAGWMFAGVVTNEMGDIPSSPNYAGNKLFCISGPGNFDYVPFSDSVVFVDTATVPTGCIGVFTTNDDGGWDFQYATIQSPADWNASTGATRILNKPDLSDVLRYSAQSLTDPQKAQARSNIGAGTYSKPGAGIPKTDLAEGVQTSLGKADTALQEHQDLSPITDLIPEQASSENQLADKEFVNSSIGTSTAAFKGTYNLVSDLNLTVSATEGQIAAALLSEVSGADNNDYAFVQIPTADATPTEISRVDRYKFNGTAWAYEWSLNNSSFTAAQWAAINSGITSGLVSKLEGIEAGAQVNVIEGVKVNGSPLTPDGNKDVSVTVPTALSQLSGDTTHRTVTDTEKTAWSGKYDKPSGGIPASDLAAGVIPDVSNFITKSVNDLTNYYLKSETYTREEVAALIGAIQQFHYEIYASTSEVTDPASNVLYLIGPTGSGADKYEEYVYANSAWTKIGDTSIDLSQYVTITALNTALASYTTTADLTTLLAGKQDVIDSDHKLDPTLIGDWLTAAEVDTLWAAAQEIEE